MDKLKIAYISSWNVQCGIAEYTRMLGHSIRKQGHEVIVLANYPVAGKEHLPGDDIPAYPFFFTGWHQERGTDYDYILQVLKENKVDLIHWQFQNYLYPQPFFAGFQQLARVAPVLVTFHDPLLPPGFPFESCRGAIFHGEATRKLLGWPKDFAIIPIGIPVVPGIPPQTVRRRLGLNSDHVLCSVGLGRTDHESIIKAMVTLKKRYSDLVYLAALPPATAHAAKNLARKLGLSTSVRLDSSFPCTSRLMEYLQAADLVFCYYPEYGVEGVYSAAARLGLGAGRPMVITDVMLMNDLPEQLKIPYGDQEALINRIIRVFEDEKYACELLEIQEKLFGSDNGDVAAQKHVDFYRKIKNYP